VLDHHAITKISYDVYGLMLVSFDMKSWPAVLSKRELIEPEYELQPILNLARFWYKLNLMLLGVHGVDSLSICNLIVILLL